ncbi:cystinosin homolog isoform X2 [Neocloeon triangulifer]|uniref:cystinosin homolog isoform X2 n=1 Tax=Neocloeon triangulifer TaxID=2078957 RepID=UPI00286F3308|nr:cystinosin homolog isoform X2 [Neocloeon triangulifer]
MGQITVFSALFCASLFISYSLAEPSFSLVPQELDVLVQETKIIKLVVQDLTVNNVVATLQVVHSGLLELSPDTIPLTLGSSEIEIEVSSIEAGYTTIFLNVTPSVTEVFDVFVRVTSLHSFELYHFSEVIGWMYFVAWSVSFYPQIYENWKRKSVVGLNFDFLSLNIIGFTLYSLFNCGLFWIPAIQQEYFEDHPRGMIPVLAQDIFFGLHAMFATIITIIQCFIYERGEQRVSWTARGIMCIFALFLGISAIIAGASDLLTWLDFLYFCSYVKLTITLIKYIPQAYMNYKRKSTVGWSIGNIFLDFTGGALSMLQMILNSHNYNDWQSIFGDPTKFGLGLFSVVFDIFFIFQHYVLYRHARKDVEADTEKY